MDFEEDIDTFRAVYESVVADVMEFYTGAMQAEMARHNAAWAAGSTDFEVYLRKSVRRFEAAYRFMLTKEPVSVCDVGGFWGVWAVTLKRLGVPEVHMSEALRYYSGAFDELFGFIESEGVQIHDLDPFEEPFPVGPFDAITVMAVVEHYPHSLRRFLENVSTACAEDGLLIMEVPNIAYWPKRVAMLGGISPLVSADVIFESETPFTGHHHEYTLREVRHLADLMNMSIIGEELYTYSPEPPEGWSGLKWRVKNMLFLVAQVLLPDARECIMVAMNKAKTG